MSYWSRHPDSAMSHIVQALSLIKTRRTIHCWKSKIFCAVSYVHEGLNIWSVAEDLAVSCVLEVGSEGSQRVVDTRTELIADLGLLLKERLSKREDDSLTQWTHRFQAMDDHICTEVCSVWSCHLCVRVNKKIVTRMKPESWIWGKASWGRHGPSAWSDILCGLAGSASCSHHRRCEAHHV